MRWLVVCSAWPLSYSLSETAQAQPPGPGLPMQAPSVKTTVVGRLLEQGHRASLPAAAPARVTSGRTDLPGRETVGVIIDGFSHQVPDIDPQETAEWLDSFDAVVEAEGRPRAQFLLMKLLERARASQVGFPATVSTPYVNSIPADAEPWFPGDEDLERRIRRCIRWNAAVMVTRANMRDAGIGGHLSTYASSASLYEVGFNHFFRGKDNGTAGDQVYFQGHASPGIYARAYVEGRLGDEKLDNFRFEVGRPRPVELPAPPPHARLVGVPDRLDGPRPVCRPSTRRASTATCSTARSPTRASRGCGASSATASSTSPRRGPRSAWRPASASTTSPSSSAATCSASTGRSGATARSSRSSRRCCAAAAGTSSRSSGAGAGTSCWPATSTACSSTR